MKIRISILLVGIYLLPNVVFGASILDFIDASFNIINDILIPFAFSLCLFYFFWGIAKYIKNSAGSESAVAESKNVMIRGVIGMFVAFSIWGIILFMQNELGMPSVQTSIQLQQN